MAVIVLQTEWSFASGSAQRSGIVYRRFLPEVALRHVDVDVRWGRLSLVVFGLRGSVVTFADGTLVEGRVLVVEGVVVVMVVRGLQGRADAHGEATTVVDCEEGPVG